MVGAELLHKTEMVSSAWAAYAAQPSLERFVELAVSVNSLAEYLIARRTVSLSGAAHELEQVVLPHLSEAAHPLPEAVRAAIGERVEALAAMSRRAVQAFDTAPERRAGTQKDEVGHDAALSGRSLWLLSPAPERWATLLETLAQLGLATASVATVEALGDRGAAGLVLVDMEALGPQRFEAEMARLAARPSLLGRVALGLPAEFDALRRALELGCERCLLAGTALPTLVQQILELTDREQPPPGRVLVVEDSKTAGHLIRRTLEEIDVQCELVDDPRAALAALARFNPDLVLMDMYMPGCTGVELTRMIRQHPAYLSVPVVYLSGETDVALQVDALRLGGDHFLTKPFNPVVLNAVVQSKIERYRALRRSMERDSLTGLLNHTTGKQALDAAIAECQGDGLAVAMLDIDHFKAINDRHGHPVGDQVIQSLAWLLRQRLRGQDIVCRYGGEEFLVALLGVDAARAYAIVDRIREDFARLPQLVRNGVFRATLSGGIAALPPWLTSGALIQAADEALYRAKANGRNQICLAA